MVRGYGVKSKVRTCTGSWSSRCLGDEGERALSGRGGNLCIERNFRLFVGYVTYINTEEMNGVKSKYVGREFQNIPVIPTYEARKSRVEREEDENGRIGNEENRGFGDSWRLR